jgi:hypothetical protein
MNGHLSSDTLETLACELGRRPKDAPTIGDVLEAVRLVRREGDALVVDVDPGAADVVAAVVDAERLCCSALDWHLDTGSTVRLRVEAKPMQLDALKAIFSSSYPGR